MSKYYLISFSIFMCSHYYQFVFPSQANFERHSSLQLSQIKSFNFSTLANGYIDKSCRVRQKDLLPFKIKRQKDLFSSPVYNGRKSTMNRCQYWKWGLHEFDNYVLPSPFSQCTLYACIMILHAASLQDHNF
jgi:hypothetical protein